MICDSNIISENHIDDIRNYYCKNIYVQTSIILNKTYELTINNLTDNEASLENCEIQNTSRAANRKRKSESGLLAKNFATGCRETSYAEFLENSFGRAYKRKAS